VPIIKSAGQQCYVMGNAVKKISENEGAVEMSVLKSDPVTVPGVNNQKVGSSVPSPDPDPVPDSGSCFCFSAGKGSAVEPS
jgi:hypothetical protein